MDLRRDQHATVWVKVASIVNNIRNRTGYGIVGDRSEKLLKAWEDGDEELTNPVLIEALTLKTGSIRATSTNWDRIVLVFSNRSIIQKLQNRDCANVKLANVLEDVIHLSDLFFCCTFLCLPKSKNIRDRNLASFVVNLVSLIMWENSFPCWLS
ncbi:hypothetical protein ACH5RR_028915 [Cinchona calisaya]|uniref:RNase H type-1 domain-containing protein n=1 Tax=Cinchona calisaya TaxID=153742 RepID=A0ABD2YTP2_9GENT